MTNQPRSGALVLGHSVRRVVAHGRADVRRDVLWQIDNANHTRCRLDAQLCLPLRHTDGCWAAALAHVFLRKRQGVEVFLGGLKAVNTNPPRKQQCVRAVLRRVRGRPGIEARSALTRANCRHHGRGGCGTVHLCTVGHKPAIHKRTLDREQVSARPSANVERFARCVPACVYAHT